MKKAMQSGFLVALGVGTVLLGEEVNAQESAFDFYGQLNLGILNYDDGRQSDSFFVDNSNSTSRIGFNYAFPSNAGNLKFNFETALGIRSSSRVDLVNGAGDFINYDRKSLRKFEFIYDDERIGSFSLGQGSMATDGAAENDLSGTSVVTYSAISELAGGNFLRDSGGALTGFRIRDTNSNFDGSRRFRVRYDTPSYSGLRFAAAYGREILQDDDKNDYYDIAVSNTYNSGSVETVGALGYSWLGNDTRQFMGSIAVLHTSTGVNGSFATGSRNGGGSYYWLKAGIRRDWTQLGETALSLDYYTGQDFVSDASDTGSWAVAVVQNFDAADFEAYLIYRQYGFREQIADYLDGNAVMVGGRWRF